MSVHALIYLRAAGDEAAGVPCSSLRPRRRRLDELLRAEAERMGLGVESIDVRSATVTLHVQAPPTVSPHKMVRDLRRAVTGAAAGGVRPHRQRRRHLRPRLHGDLDAGSGDGLRGLRAPHSKALGAEGGVEARAIRLTASVRRRLVAEPLGPWARRTAWPLRAPGSRRPRGCHARRSAGRRAGARRAV